MPIRLVLFDLDGVLCRYDVKRRLEALAELSGRSPETIHHDLWGSGFEDAADAGAYATPEAYLKAFAERLSYPISRAQWIAARRAAMVPSHEVLALAERLTAKVMIAVLTNNVALFKSALDEVFPEVPRLFGKHVFVSCDFHVRKPDPDIYLAALHEVGLGPSEAFFIDDKPANVEGAIAAGLSGHHFTTFERLVAALGHHGLDPA
jgi:glucose-1-phosphatase